VLLDSLETASRRAGAGLAVAAALSLVPGLASSVRPDGRTVGHPELVFSQARLTGITIGWLACAAVLWRPLPLRLGVAARAAFLLPSTLACFGGLGLALAGRLALGSAYRPSSTVGVRLAPGQRLVTEGPYRFVRHPMYSGLVLAAVGALGLYRTWTTLLLVAQLPVLAVRARREDQALEAEFGAEWRAYRDRVPAWSPRLGPT
jgi:hypothetical protein